MGPKLEVVIDYFDYCQVIMNDLQSLHWAFIVLDDGASLGNRKCILLLLLFAFQFLNGKYCIFMILMYFQIF